MNSSLASPDLHRVREVIALLPPGPFSDSDFLGLAIGINALDNCHEVMPLLDALTDAGDIVRVGDANEWVRR